MNSDQAKQILRLYRPNTRDAVDPAFAEALRLARADSQLKSWFDNHCQVCDLLRLKFSQIEPPPHLKQKILAEVPPLIPLPRWRRYGHWAAAAILLLLGISATLWIVSSGDDHFAQFRFRMVKMALKQYDRMDLETHRMEILRQFFAHAGTPSDYLVPGGLSQTSLTGGKALRWHNHPVSMVCFDRGDRQMIFLFVVDRGATPDAPSTAGLVAAHVSNLVTASWTQGNLTYLLAGPEELGFPEKYLGPAKP